MVGNGIKEKEMKAPTTWPIFFSVICKAFNAAGLEIHCYHILGEIVSPVMSSDAIRSCVLNDLSVYLLIENHITNNPLKYAYPLQIFPQFFRFLYSQIHTLKLD